MSGKNLQESLKDVGPGMSEGRKHERLRTALVVSEVALACMLLVGAGLLLRSFMKVLEVDLGFEPTRSAALRIDYPKGNNPEERGATLKDLLQRVSAIPGIESAAVTDSLPLDWNRSWGLSAKGRSFRKDELPGAFVYIVTPGYLGTMGMHLLEGRDFNWSDTTKSLNAVIINQSAARYLWPGQDPIGRTALVNGSDAIVIGLVADVRESSLEGNPGWQMYMSMMQQGPAGAELVVRTKLAPSVLASSVMSVVRSIDPDQPATEFQPIQTFVDHAVSPRGFFMLLVGVFAVLGLLLASLGIYGVIAYSVARKTQEIGIRMALGATQSRVLGGVIARTMIMALLGIATGTVASLLMAKGIASLLFGTQPHDPATYIGMVIVLVVVAFIAGYIPALRASRVNPMVALRNN
jgi:predicted permease